MRKIILMIFAIAFLIGLVSASGLCGDTNNDSVLDETDLSNINSYAFDDVAVPSGVNVDLNADGSIDVFDISIMANHVNRGAPAPTCGNSLNSAESCEFTLSPDSLEDNDEENIYHDGEDRLQKVLDDAGYNIDVDDDQTNIQMWRTLEDVDLEVTYLKTISAHRHEFGYYMDREAEEMNDIFRDDETAIEHAVVGDKFRVEIEEGKNIGFYIKAIRDDGAEYFTENVLNMDEKDRVVVYDLGDEFIIAFEDWVDYDYQDLVVSVKVICENGDDEDEDDGRQSHASDGKYRVIDLGAGFCEPNWQCSGWSECVLGQTIRICEYKNHCGFEYNKPIEQTACELPNVLIEDQPKKADSYGIWLIVALIIIAIIVLLYNWNEFG